eukprot:CAMPEP_0194148648 /NCGR_PEP_ID=MMETSP0152-20130528/33620_1 /TAXON_ID=1049557 /ORGANISM="Thalassiothrix antarctica, Strain L6-D1" /LENGTH=322 /DNA_ID=CAMNT_0038850309 /DNA_START=126 /DNA_END=1094 /DNA_ORIENTATION=+
MGIYNSDRNHNHYNIVAGIASAIIRIFLFLFGLFILPLRLLVSSSSNDLSKTALQKEDETEILIHDDDVNSREDEIPGTTVTSLDDIDENKESITDEDENDDEAIVIEGKESIAEIDETKSENAVKDIIEERRTAVGTVDLSGEWKLIVTAEFKKEYNDYLKYLGQPKLFRAVAMGLIGLLTEYTKQTEDGRELFIRSRNPKGVWERTLIASSDANNNNTIIANDEQEQKSDEPNNNTKYYNVLSADGETVQAEAWWEKNGTIHQSWLRGGGSKYNGGGDFESKRYLEKNGKVLVCESIFHPRKKNNTARVTWKFLRKGEAI